MIPRSAAEGQEVNSRNGMRFSGSTAIMRACELCIDSHFQASEVLAFSTSRLAAFMRLLVRSELSAY